MDTEMLAAEVEVAVLEEHGCSMTATEYALRFAGASTEKAMEKLEEHFGRAFPDDHVQIVNQRINERLWREAKTIDGVHEMLDKLDQPRCICSNAGMEKLKIELTRGELWDRFRPYIYSAEDIEGVGRKPLPDVFLHAAKEFGVNPKACAVVEDSASGVEGAKAAGMRVIGFTGGSHTYEGHADLLTDMGAETVIRRLADSTTD